MKYLILFVFLFTLSCTINKVKNNHGVLSLENKFSKPATKSTFDNKV